MDETKWRPPERLDLIDAARGLSILLMVAYHFGYDLVVVKILPEFIVFNPLLHFLQNLFAGLFIFISGVSARFSRNNIKRGAVMLLFAAAISAVTYLMDSPILFGILHFLGSAALIYGITGRFLNRIESAMYPAACALLFAVTHFLTGIRVESDYLWAFGFFRKGFSSADYFPLLPWIFVYLAGAWFGRLVVERRLPEWFYTFSCPFLPGVGRKTFLVYILHQPVLYGILWIILRLKGDAA